MHGRRYYRARSPELQPSPDEPLWFFYEMDHEADAVLRSVELFADGKATRNSIALEQRHGDECPSLIDQSLDIGFAEAPLEEIGADEFERRWASGEDRPFWFPLSNAGR